MKVKFERIGVQTRRKHYGKVYPAELSFEPHEFSANSCSWLWPALLALRRKSQLRPLVSDTVRHLQIGLASVEVLQSWGSLCAKPPRMATLDDVLRLFSELEDTLATTYRHAPRQAGRVSAVTRRFVRDYLRAAGADGRLQRLSSVYRTQLPIKSSSRALISDAPGRGKAPLGAIPHSSIGDLKSKSSQLLEEDLERIKAACRAEIARYHAAVRTLHKLRSVTDPKVEIEWLRAQLRGAYLRRRELITGPHSEVAIAMMLQLAARLAPPLDAAQGTYAGSWTAVTKLKPMIDGFGQNILQIANVEVAPPVTVLTAAAILLMAHTQWNFSSVLELTADDIDARALPYRLQSIKTKTGDATPPALITAADHDALLAVRLLQERLTLLKQRGWVPETEVRLWLSSTRILSGNPDNVAHWQSGLKKIIERYKLPHFSYEQIRNQTVSMVVFNSGSLEDGQLAAGHASLSTTHRYVHGVLMQRRNSAILLEFEKRFDATVRFMIDPETVPADQRLVAYPVGDGSSCGDPQHPPDDKWLASGVCNAKHCHSGKGCEHRLLHIDEPRLEELVHTRRFYRSHWRRLHAQNAAEFETYHLNAMLFNLALYGYIERGPYRHLLVKYEKQQPD